MIKAFIRRVFRLELEERILNAAALIGLIGVFLPWISGDWLGSETVAASGFGFYVSFLGIGTFLALGFIFLMTLVPLTGGPPLIRKSHAETVRVSLASLSTVLILSALSVLTKVTFEFSRMEVRFGIYVSLIGSFTTLLYCYIQIQKEKKAEMRKFFHQPDTLEEEDTPLMDHNQDPMDDETPRLPLNSRSPLTPPSKPEEHTLVRNL